jgi:hypothetical protein
MPIYDFSSGLGLLGQGIDSLGASLKSADQQAYAQALGQKINAGDWAGAQTLAAQRGDLDTWSKLRSLGAQSGPAPSVDDLLVGGPSASSTAAAAGSAPAGARGVSALAPKAANYFLSSGLVNNPLGAAALAAGFQAESGYDPSAVAKGDGRDGSDAVNIGQWNGSRAVDFRNFYQANKLDPKDPATGLAFARYELANKPEYAGIVQALNAARTPQDAQAAAIGYWAPKGYTAGNPQGAADFQRRLNYTKAISTMLAAAPALAAGGGATAAAPVNAGGAAAAPAAGAIRVPKLGGDGKPTGSYYEGTFTRAQAE